MTKDQCCVLKHLTAGETEGFEKIGELGDGEFLDALIAKGLVRVLDWAGEDSTGDVGKFISSRLDALQSSVALECDKIYAGLEKEAEKEDFKRGDASLFLMNEFQKALKKSDFRLFTLDLHSDAYYLLVAHKNAERDFKKMAKREEPFWDIAPWGKRRKRQILYVINCECGEMSAWQLDADEPSPRDEVCEVCGRVLFDAEGNAMQPLEKEFI
ncbi:hypothetical protein [uncultured Campylobacter sp.]|uniref:DUF6630 family protein n=1 Tax=uncultured Campylobacter sp. TaxID=218934 RepID=UPI00261F70CF|nr:hypothetical protein [uncultured Campylobacter sp.]